MYTIESLRVINPRYDADHKINQSDVDKANMYVDMIQNSKNDNQIQTGDIVELTTQHGDFYKNAHIESYDEETDRWSVCEQPYTPFIYINDKGLLRCNTSGGAWSGVPNNLKLIGKRKKFFCDWGHWGACANGAINFEAEVNVWEYKHEEPLYSEFSTEKWDKFYVSYCVDEFGNPKNGSQYRWFVSRHGMSSTAFVNQKDYDAWLKTLRAVTFKGNWPNQTVVFGYKQQSHLIGKDKWDELDLPKDTRLCNGVNLCKVKYDDENNVIDVYRFSNSGDMDWKRYKEYELARGRDLTKEGF